MIKFGTSGWRAIIGDQFTFENVRKVTQAIANYILKTNPENPRVIIGYDTRFLSDHFAREASSVLAGNGIRTSLSIRDVPTPVIAHAIKSAESSGGLNFTASHNPSEYNGLKFSTPDGAPAPPEITRAIEEEIQKVDDVKVVPPSVFEEMVSPADLRTSYTEKVYTLVDIDALKRANLKIGYDALYGTGREYLDQILMECGMDVHALHNYLDPYFGGATPDCKAENLKELKKMIRESDFDLGLATDGDADRFGIVDSSGHYVYPNYILAMLAWYLTEHRGWRSGLGRTVATTHLIDRVAERYDVEVFETPVGFKYLGELFIDGKIHFGGEESAGLSIADHVPEKDGILACLLVAEMVNRLGKSLHQLQDDLFVEFGELYSRRVDIKLTESLHEKAGTKLAKIENSIGDFSIVRKDTRDGVKCYGEDGSWVLFRLSGTEPIIRIYAESGRSDNLRYLLKISKQFILEE